MDHLAQTLENYLAEYFRSALGSDADSSVRPILIGPPLNALRALFERLTLHGTTDWTVTLPAGTVDVVVLLVSNATGPAVGAPAAHVSQECHWDYAVTVRNSSKLVLILVDPHAWDNRPESLRNTTETLGTLSLDRSNRWLQDPLWKSLVGQVQATSGVLRGEINASLKSLAKYGESLGASERDTAPWTAINELLAPAPGGLTGSDSIAFACGFPAPGGIALPDTVRNLERLADFLAGEGLTDGVDQLKQTTAAGTHGLVPHLDDLLGHLNGTLLSAATMTRAPASHYQPGTTVPAWWTDLTAPRIQEMLDELEGGPPQGRLRLTCTNALNATDQVDGEPLIVANEVELRASTDTDGTLPAVTYARRLPRAVPQMIPGDPADLAACNDTSPPDHLAPLKYQVSAIDHRPGGVDVLSLETFGCHGTARVPDADRNKPPARRRGQATWRQEIILPRGGAVDLGVFHSAATHTVRLTIQKTSTVDTAATLPGSFMVTFLVDIEDRDEVTVTLLDAAGQAVGEWEIAFSIQESQVVSSSWFEALVHAHQGRAKLGVPRVPDIPCQRLEALYIHASDSWTPVLACWPGEVDLDGPIDWDDPRLGGPLPDIDPRPAALPPDELLAAREAVRLFLAGKDRPIALIDLGEAALQPLVKDYLEAYISWLGTSPHDAPWFDCVAIYVAEWNAQASTHLPSREPVAILLSPLHPFRLGWHCLAQAQLAESINDATKRCPAAGLLDPTSCPDSGAWYLQLVGQAVERGFLSIECEHPHWAVLINKEYIAKAPELDRARECLADLGLPTKGISGGFTRSQAIDSLNEVMGLLPGRANLRVGIVGSRDSSPASADGVIHWSEGMFEEESDGEPGPFYMEVYDSRETPHPSEERLADLSERTGEKVKWFKLLSAAPAPAQLDLVIIDQLGTMGPAARDGTTTSAIGHGALCRVRIRQDFQNGTLLRESRVGLASGSPSEVAGLLQNAVAAFEGRSAYDHATQFEFQPVQQAIGTRLNTSTFVAVTSSQIDPACIVRGARGQGGYLWNYELPGALGGSENRVGYYLVARPVDAMEKAIERSAELLTVTPPNTQLLLDEISRRGIPIMKRLVGGGSGSRGELGLLLAVRLLQDSFRTGATNVQLPVWQGECVHLLLPMDPYAEAFDRIRKVLRKSSTAQRPDILVIAIRVPPAPAPVQLKITPLEVKFREGQMSNTAVRDALGQAANLGNLLDALWMKPPLTELWASCRAALLAQCLDFSFRVYADPTVHGRSQAEWTDLHERVLRAVLDRTAEVSATTAGRLLVFDESTETALSDMDADSRLDTAVISRDDAEVLLNGVGMTSQAATDVARQLDLSFPSCGGTNATPATPPPASGQAPTAPAPTTPTAQQQAPVPAEPGPAPAPTPAGPTTTASSGGEPVVPQPPAAPAPAPASAVVAATPPIPEPPAGAPVPGAPVVGGQSLIPPEIRQRVREAFEGFIGNATAVKRITNDLLRALIEQPPYLAKNYLFTGQPSTGKTEIARRMSVALGLPFVKLDGRGVQSRNRLFELINGELNQQGQPPSQVGQTAGLPIMQYPPLVVFIDEVHLVPRSVQESLLTMLEAADRTVTLEDHVARVNRATFLFATTRASDVDAAFRTRCAEVQLKEYELEEVAEIVRRRTGAAWPAEVYTEIARLGRSVPRVALELAKELETELTVTEYLERPVTEHLDEVRKAREIDKLGLTVTDYEYLKILERENRPVGEQPMVNMLGTVDKDRVLNEVEPFLKRLNFIRLGARGREITDQGKEYVLSRRRNG
jgi:DNA phosphorothioation-dependent restriction protein DptH